MMAGLIIRESELGTRPLLKPSCTSYRMPQWHRSSLQPQPLPPTPFAFRSFAAASCARRERALLQFPVGGGGGGVQGQAAFLRQKDRQTEGRTDGRTDGQSARKRRRRRERHCPRGFSYASASAAYREPITYDVHSGREGRVA